MGEQRLHHALAPIDLLTRLELEQVLSAKLDAFTRDFYRGKSFNEENGNCLSNTGAAVASFTIPGPDSGYLWAPKMFAVTVNGLVSTTPAVNAIPLGASGVATYNNNSVGVNLTISGGTVSQIAINGTNTNLTSGTFFVPAGGTVTVTYTVAPTTFATAGIAVTSQPFVNVYAGDNANSAPIATGQCINGVFVYSWGSCDVVIKDQRNITVTCSTGTTLGVFKLVAQQVPTEMEGKL